MLFGDNHRISRWLFKLILACPEVLDLTDSESLLFYIGCHPTGFILISVGRDGRLQFASASRDSSAYH
jgi:hypothetical protein